MTSEARVIGYGHFLRVRPDDQTDAEAAAAMAALDDAGLAIAEVDAFFVRGATAGVDALDRIDAAVALIERHAANVVVVATAIEPDVAAAVVLVAPSLSEAGRWYGPKRWAFSRTADEDAPPGLQ